MAEKEKIKKEMEKIKNDLPKAQNVEAYDQSQDEFAERPEDVLDEEDLEELKELENESEEVEAKPVKKRFGDRQVETEEVWDPKTKLGEDVKAGRIKDVDEILNSGKKILEEQIIDTLVNIKSDLLAIGQSKGKFGGGKRRAWRQTQRKTKEGNVATFSAMAVVGDEKGHVGVGNGRATETLPARDKATRKAKLNLIKVERACGGFDCDCSELHTIPFKVTGKAGSVRITLIPAPQGTGLVVANEVKKILKLAGIKDIYGKTSGRARTTFNLIKACMDALEKTTMRNKKWL